MKRRKAMKTVFKPYNMGQMLLPQSYDAAIPEEHLARVVNRAVDQIDVDNLVGQAASSVSS